MKSIFTILKLTLIVLLLVGLTIGFIFFRVWQKNDRPSIHESSWSQSKLILGHAAQLDFTITAPWHRKVTRATPLSHPPFLVPVENQAKLRKGSLTLKGQRQWHLSIPFVATDTKPLDGLTASFPLEPTKRISPNSLTLPLPPLTLTSPADIPESPHDPESFLTEEKPAPAPPLTFTKTEDSKPWLWWLLALLLIPLIYFILKRSGILKTTPPWEKALARLAQLDPNSQEIPFYSKLTDILKQYTSERYSVRARSKTSTEFIETLKKQAGIPTDPIDKLNSFAQLSDAVKFAGYSPSPSKAPESLELIRNFVTTTTPETDSSDV